jgi:hypothetical protein
MLAQGLISDPKGVLEKISAMTGGTATVDDKGRVAVASPQWSAEEIREEFTSPVIPYWKAVQAF